MRKKEEKKKKSPKNHSLSSHQVAAASLPPSLRRSDHYVRWMCVRALKQCILKACCRISVRRPAARTSMKIFPDPPPVNQKHPPPALPPTNPARPLRHSRGGMTEELQSAPATHRTRSDCSGEKMGPVGLTDQNNPPRNTHADS